MVEDEHVDNEREFCAVLDDMTKSFSAVREVIQNLNQNPVDADKGISLLSLKHNLLLSYLQSLTLVSAQRVLGHSLTSRTRPTQPFSASARGPRGTNAGDLVDILVEDRVVLEKIKQLEGKMRYQIQKLVKLANEDDAENEIDVINDPLAFRPNPENLIDRQETDSDANSGRSDKDGSRAIYHPPRLAPVPYIEKKDKKAKRAPLPAGLAALSHLDGVTPHIESSSGLGGAPSMASTRAKELRRINEYEEENMTRLVMTKKEERRRARDEADIALGGSGMSNGRQRGGILEDEFGDILRAVDRGGGGGESGGLGDGYETLRIKGRKQDLLSRSRVRPRDVDDDDDAGRKRKKTTFQAAVRKMGKKRHRR